ncbi:MAG TPA: PIN domain-containing protein [Stellaceae bacterium]|jgi:predicted nucleic acid-binding protein|nr:PIN domain-containing protein [Stellaceae bacterium]
MRSGVLLDTGPLVAYLNERDAHHDWTVEAFSELDPPVITCEPVLSEACFLIERNRQPGALVLDFALESEFQVGLQLGGELAAVRALMQRYVNVPMSLADACLVRLAELTALPICTLDGDFAIYRAHGRRPLQLIAPERRHLHEP